jgi:hypothetical protein
MRLSGVGQGNGNSPLYGIPETRAFANLWLAEPVVPEKVRFSAGSAFSASEDL